MTVGLCEQVSGLIPSKRGIRLVVFVSVAVIADMPETPNACSTRVAHLVGLLFKSWAIWEHL